ncbi:MAG: phosphoglucosamine mutase, partial [Saprospiraceae bacterium]|nr:phosphoglucosamine mutase [Saprospiraceae bacterium]
DGQALLDLAADRSFVFVSVDNLGKVIHKEDALDLHIKAILDLPFINTELIRSRKFKVAVDCINSTGALALPPLLDALGCSYTLINKEVTGAFAHNPEPVAQNLLQLSAIVKDEKLDLGIAVDPDVDRLVFTCPSGELFGEEYTLVAAADFVLRHKKGATVSNLSSSRALRDVSHAKGVSYHAAAVGEVNVVATMKAVNAVIGGEGNGGVILPDLHYGRDAMVGIALVLNLLAEDDIDLDQLKSKYPQYQIIKSKVKLGHDTDIDAMINKLKKAYINDDFNELDGLKIDFEDGWVHLRKSNTEPIIRIIAESKTKEGAQALIDDIKELLN